MFSIHLTQLSSTTQSTEEKTNVTKNGATKSDHHSYSHHHHYHHRHNDHSDDDDFEDTCPSKVQMDFARGVRGPLKNMVEKLCPKPLKRLGGWGFWGEECLERGDSKGGEVDVWLFF